MLPPLKKIVPFLAPPLALMDSCFYTLGHDFFFFLMPNRPREFPFPSRTHTFGRGFHFPRLVASHLLRRFFPPLAFLIDLLSLKKPPPPFKVRQERLFASDPSKNLLWPLFPKTVGVTRLMETRVFLSCFFFPKVPIPSLMLIMVFLDRSLGFFPFQIADASQVEIPCSHSIPASN